MHTPPPQHSLPVIEHMVTAYKLWYEYRDHMPKKSRYVMGDRIETRFIQVLELLSVASFQSKADKLPTLERALSSLDVLKFLLRIAWEVRVFDEKKYAALSQKLQEVAKQVGGWKKGIQGKGSGA